ncbi:MAG: hypothetical protein ACK5LX_13230 [Oscillospiraceae bacterium]
MKRNCAIIGALALFCFVLIIAFSACSGEETGPSEEESQEAALPVESSAAEQPIPEVSRATVTQEDADLLTVTVKPFSATAIYTEFSVLQPELRREIIAALEEVKEAEPVNPTPYSETNFFEVVLSDGRGVVDSFVLHSATDSNGDNYLIYDEEWYAVDSSLWDSLEDLYPAFGEAGLPEKMVSISSSAKSKGAGFAYYGEGGPTPQVSEEEGDGEEEEGEESETEFESSVEEAEQSSSVADGYSADDELRASTILGYLESMESDQPTASTSQKDQIRITVHDFEDDTTVEYICYDIYNSAGNCVVRSGDDWFAADPKLYNYMDGLL